MDRSAFLVLIGHTLTLAVTARLPLAGGRGARESPLPQADQQPTAQTHRVPWWKSVRVGRSEECSGQECGVYALRSLGNRIEPVVGNLIVRTLWRRDETGVPACIRTDANGIARSVGNAVDIGAHEQSALLAVRPVWPLRSDFPEGRSG